MAVLRLIARLVLSRRLDRQVRWLLALQDAIRITGGEPMLVDVVGSIGEQAACHKEEALTASSLGIPVPP